jgi:general secretion pathway protein K
MSMNNKHRGGALLTALFIMTLVSIVAVAMSAKVQMDIYRTRLMITHDKLYYASQAITFWAMNELSSTKQSFTKADDKGMLSSYPKGLATIYPSVTLSGALYDLQARCNLNNLANKKTLLGFVNFVEGIAPQIPMSEKVNLTFAINDWVSEYQYSTASQAFLSYYLKQKPPYHPSHQLMSSFSELRLIKDVSPSTYKALEPYSTALPELTPVNINTAPKPVLLAISEFLDEKKAKELIKARGKNGFKNTVQANQLMERLKIPAELVTLESTYFLSVAHASSEQVHFTVYTLLKRSQDKNGIRSVKILSERFE